ncbi:hypothetical protein VTI74DRAFT_4321 [Chaetomium olivicolor]
MKTGKHKIALTRARSIDPKLSATVRSSCIAEQWYNAGDGLHLLMHWAKMVSIFWERVCLLERCTGIDDWSVQLPLIGVLGPVHSMTYFQTNIYELHFRV